MLSTEVTGLYNSRELTVTHLIQRKHRSLSPVATSPVFVMPGEKESNREQMSRQKYIPQQAIVRLRL